MDWLESLLTWPVFIYFVIIILCQIVLQLVLFSRKERIDRKRAQVGLPKDVITDTAELLTNYRKEAFIQAGLLLLTVLVVPILILIFLDFTRLYESGKDGLLVVFLSIIIWLLIQGTDVGKSFLVGVAFKTLLAFQKTIQVGDRVTLKGHSGKVEKIGIFFVNLVTPNDDFISIPSSQLWSDVLVSANARERSSLCVMDFYLAPFVTNEMRQKSEDVIWEAIQASPFCETAKPMQIFYSQEPDSIHLTAKAYVATTYDEPLFKSDVTRAFLEVAAKSNIPLASGQWWMTPPNLQHSSDP